MVLERKNYTLKDVFLLIFCVASSYCAILVFIYLLIGILPYLSARAISAFIDTVLCYGSQIKLTNILLPCFMIILLTLFEWTSSLLKSFYKVKLEMQLRKKINFAIIEKRASILYQYYEKEETLNLMERVCDEPEKKLSGLIMNVLDLLSILINIISIMALFTKYVPKVSIVYFILFVVLYILALISGKKMYEAKRSVSKQQRRYKYFEEVLTRKEYVEERTVFRYGDQLNERWYEIYEGARIKQLLIRTSWFLKSKLPSIVALFISGYVITLLFPYVKEEVISLGLYMAIINGLLSLAHTMSWQLSFQSDILAQNKEYVADFSKFINLEETTVQNCADMSEVPELNKLEFRNVSFAYPETDRNILNNLSFTIEKGKHYSFVGVNGSGKTTIVKLLLGFYKNYTGEILLNGKDIRTIKNLPAYYSVVFQDFAKYFISVEENVQTGTFKFKGEQISEEDTVKVLEKAGLYDYVCTMKHGIKTVLGKIHTDGHELSGGQWQKLAIARAIMNPASLRILDEPTAALDPVAENNLYTQFEEISKGKTTIFISHRLGSTLLSDEILVIDKGTVIEKGTHKELMQQNGLYADMFNKQRSWYSEGEM